MEFETTAEKFWFQILTKIFYLETWEVRKSLGGLIDVIKDPVKIILTENQPIDTFLLKNSSSRDLGCR